MNALERLKFDVCEPLEDAPYLVSCLASDLALALAVVEAAIPLAKVYGSAGSTGQWQRFGNTLKTLTT